VHHVVYEDVAIHVRTYQFTRMSNIVHCTCVDVLDPCKQTERGFPSVGLFPTCGFLVVVASLVCSGLHGVVLWDVRPVLLGVCAWRLSGSLPGVSHHCLSILQIARCFSPGAPPRRQLLKWPCGLPVSCPGVSRLASRGLSLHDLVL
jgi:hypothetical protein